jgi:predicted phosphodiesterase
MKIAIWSDSHDNFQNLEKAIKIANDNNCEYFLFAWDFITPSWLWILWNFRLIIQNNLHLF